MFRGFRDFLLRGNVVDLAVAVVIGAAFGSVVTSLTKNFITPLIGALGGAPDFSAVKLGPIMIGNVVNDVLSFVITAAVVYFAVVMPMNRLLARLNPSESAPATKRACPECLSDIPLAAKRCSFCTSPVAPVG